MEKKWVWAVVMEKKSEELFLEPSRAFDPPHPTSGGGGRGVDKTHGHTGEKNEFFWSLEKCIFYYSDPPKLESLRNPNVKAFVLACQE